MKELQAVLELSRVRADSQVMRGDAYRVARYFRHQWAGIAPLPGETTIVLKVERTPVPDKVP